jgi:hypothetical protein
MNPIPNKNEAENYVVLAVIAGTSTWAGAHGIDASTWANLVTGAAPIALGAAAAIYSFVRNFNMKKVHEDAVVASPAPSSAPKA